MTWRTRTGTSWERQLFQFPARFTLKDSNGIGLICIFGNFIQHEYQMQINGSHVANVHRKWFSVRDQLGVTFTGPVDNRLVIGEIVVIEHIEVTRRNDASSSSSASGAGAGH
jgi:uncharacterized protein YxjI